MRIATRRGNVITHGQTKPQVCLLEIAVGLTALPFHPMICTAAKIISMAKDLGNIVASRTVFKMSR